MSENIFLEQNSQHRECEAGDSGKTGKKSRYQNLNTMELRRGICVRSKHKYELKLKLKGTKRSNEQQIQSNYIYPK